MTVEQEIKTLLHKPASHQRIVYGSIANPEALLKKMRESRSLDNAWEEGEKIIQEEWGSGFGLRVEKEKEGYRASVISHTLGAAMVLPILQETPTKAINRLIEKIKDDRDTDI